MPERDISSPSGRKLTLISPPMITNQIYALNRGQVGFHGHITSLQPIRPQDVPDSWEKQALQAFSSGQSEADTEATIDGKRYFRLMRPLVIEKCCLTCHAEQGYKVGDLRGGLSISVPMDSMGHAVAGRHPSDRDLCGDLASRPRRHWGHVARSRTTDVTTLPRGAKTPGSPRSARRCVTERTAELAETNHKLENEIIERRQAEQWLLESERRFRGYFDQGLVGMAILSAGREWVEVNVRLGKMLGYPEEELLMVAWQDLIHAEDRSAVEAEFQRMLGGIVRGFVTDARLVPQGRPRFHAGLSAQCMLKSDGTIDCILVLVQDMTRLRPA